jgi:hypothetical protein
MSKIEDGGDAFPRQDDEWSSGARGMSLRDYFAGQALAGLTANPEYEDLDVRKLVSWSYDIADLMIQKRESTND